MSEIENLICECARQDVGAITGHLRSCVCPLCNAKVLRLTTSMRKVVAAAVNGERERCAVIADGWTTPATPCSKPIDSDKDGVRYRCGYIEGHHLACETMEQRRGGNVEGLPLVGAWNQQIATAIRKGTPE